MFSKPEKFISLLYNLNKPFLYCKTLFTIDTLLTALKLKFGTSLTSLTNRIVFTERLRQDHLKSGLHLKSQNGTAPTIEKARQVE